MIIPSWPPPSIDDYSVSSYRGRDGGIGFQVFHHDQFLKEFASRSEVGEFISNDYLDRMEKHQKAHS